MSTPPPPSSPGDVRRPAGAAVPELRATWPIRIGQTGITLVLAAIGAARAVADGTPLVWALAMSVLFVGWYVGGLALGDRTRDHVVATWWLAGLTVIWAGAVAVSAEFVWLAFPLWLLAGFILPVTWGVALSATILAVAIAAPVLHTGTTTYANVIGPLIGGVFAFGIARGYLTLIRDGEERRSLIASLVASQEEAAQLQEELARTQRETGAGIERTRLSRDIHDTVAQSLTSIGMLARSAAATDDRAKTALGQIEQLAHEGLVDTRRIVNAMTPAELEGSALGDAVRRMLTRLNDETGIRTDLHIDESVPALPMAVEVVLLRVVQSALANVRRHARAHRVVVTLADAGDAVRLDIVDDGIGFDAHRWRARRHRSDDGGYGLRAMRARLRELGGSLDLESAPGEGVALSASVPLNASDGAR